MIKDWRGKEIKVGSIVVYPGRSGSSMWMSEGKVIDIQQKLQFVWVPHVYVPVLKVEQKDGTVSFIKRIDRVTVVEQEKTKPKINYGLEDYKKQYVCEGCGDEPHPNMACEEFT